MIVEIKNTDFNSEKYSYHWEEEWLIFNHNMEKGTFVYQVYDDNNSACLIDSVLMQKSIKFDFRNIDLTDKSYSVVFLSDTKKTENTDDSLKVEYYSGTISDVMLFCKSLNIGNGKLSKINTEIVEKYMAIVDGLIDSYLQDYYFVPVRKYNRVQIDGSLKKVFPGKIRLIALQWTAGLLLQSEFQNLQPNQSQAVMKYIEQARKEIYQITLYNARIPGLRWKANGISHFAPPELMPSKNPERME